jgi:uncharacterized protein YbjT (DUF2867 family)
MILVVGATGALGGAVTRDLLQRGEAVRVLVRPGSGYGELVEAGAQPVMGDVRDAESLRRACMNVTTVITTANSASRGGADTVDAVDRLGNRQLIDEAKRADVEQFIFVSALGASTDSPVDFMRAKAETENYLRASGLTWTIVQPNVFMDVWVGMLVGLPVSEARPVVLVGRGDHRHALVAIHDVAQFVVASVGAPAARNRVLIVAGPQAVTWTQVVEKTGAVLGRPLEVQYIEPGQPLPKLPAVASGLAAAMETYETVIDMTETASRFGVSLTSVDEWLTQQFSAPLNA